MTSTRPSKSTNKSTQSVPLRLHLVFVLGFLFSLLVIAAAIYFFAAYEVGNWMPWLHEPRISQARLFEIVRNGVTTAAALGVGVTLFFSYRRQQTAEAAQALATQAQSVAAQALTLATQQHTDELAKRQDDRVRALRERFSTYAEHLSGNQVALSIAAVHSLEALADEWHSLGYDQERQNCVSLMCSILRMEHATQENYQVREFIYRTIIGRLQRGLPDGAYWPVKVDLSNRAKRHQKGLLVEGADLSLRGIHPDMEEDAYYSAVELVRGQLDMSDLDLSMGNFYFDESTFSGGLLTLGAGEESGNGWIKFRNCRFVGSDVVVLTGSRGIAIEFEDCVFSAGALKLPRHSYPERVSLKRCAVNSNFFEPSATDVGMAYVGILVDDRTSFAEGTRKLATKHSKLRPQFAWESDSEYQQHPFLPPKPPASPNASGGDSTST